jgi:hypothetical protein
MLQATTPAIRMGVRGEDMREGNEAGGIILKMPEFAKGYRKKGIG